MAPSVAFRLSAPTILLNRWQRLHWNQRRLYARNLAWEIRAAIVGPLPAKPLERARAVVRRKSVSAPDFDGLVGGMKPLIDCLLVASDRHPFGLGIVVDDSADRFTLDARHVQVARRNEQGTCVEIWPA